VVSHENGQPGVVQRAIDERGLSRHVALRVPSFLAGLSVVATSDLLMNAPRPLVDEIVDQFGLEIMQTPIPIPTVSFALLWHERFSADPVHRWAREQLLDWVTNRFRPARLARVGTRSM
jgi:DNA-binding transcriptional LysR family regulator